ncbi:hypothetical protein D3C59_17515 [Streptomyces sp. SHP22-7]|nr:hypothetical protein D3C59_17515 [Streptomyces sp. SHP22-7]
MGGHTEPGGLDERLVAQPEEEILALVTEDRPQQRHRSDTGLGAHVQGCLVSLVGRGTDEAAQQSGDGVLAQRRIRVIGTAIGLRAHRRLRSQGESQGVPSGELQQGVVQVREHASLPEERRCVGLAQTAEGSTRSSPVQPGSAGQ